MLLSEANRGFHGVEESYSRSLSNAIEGSFGVEDLWLTIEFPANLVRVA